MAITSCIFVSSEQTTWTDAGNYNESWLGEYDKTTLYEIKTNQDFAAFLAASKAKYSFENKIIKISSNIDMSDHLWIPAFSDEVAFAGLLEGQGDDIGLYGDSRHERNEVERMRHDTSLLKGDADCAILK